MQERSPTCCQPSLQISANLCCQRIWFTSQRTLPSATVLRGDFVSIGLFGSEVNVWSAQKHVTVSLYVRTKQRCTGHMKKRKEQKIDHLMILSSRFVLMLKKTLMIKPMQSHWLRQFTECWMLFATNQRNGQHINCASFLPQPWAWSCHCSCFGSRKPQQRKWSLNPFNLPVYHCLSTSIFGELLIFNANCWHVEVWRFDMFDVSK